MNSFIVTGGAGFIGSNLVKQLNESGWTDITIVDHISEKDTAKRRNLDQLKYSEYFDKKEFRGLLNSEKIREVDCVFHLGACSSTTETDEDYLRDNNYQYTKDLCEWSLKHGARFIYASSAATYGDGSFGYSDSDENTLRLLPLNAYGRSKQQFDLWALQSGVSKKIVGLKYFNVYGPGEDHKGDMRSIVNKAYPMILRDKKMKLFKSNRPDFKDGEQRRDFIYVDDAVEATIFFYLHPGINGLFNCGTGEARTWKDLAASIFSSMNLPLQIEWIDMPETIREKYQYHTQADISKLRKAGYASPFISIEEGVRRYVTDYLIKQSENVQR